MRPRRRLPLGLIVPAALVLLVASLATLQYRWLGQVSEAERERLQKGLTQSAEEFADDFDRELLRVYTGLQTDGALLQRHDWSEFATRYDRWREAARFPQIVRGVYLVLNDGERETFHQYLPEAREFQGAEWPQELEAARKVLTGPHQGTRVDDSAFGAARTLLSMHDPIVASVPAVIISLPSWPALEPPRKAEAVATYTSVFSVRLSTASLVVEFDREFIRTTLLPTLVARYFPDRNADQYRFAVVDAADAASPIYARGLAAGQAIARERADASVPLFAIRRELAPQVIVRSAAGVPGAGAAAEAPKTAATTRGVDTRFIFSGSSAAEARSVPASPAPAPLATGRAESSTNVQIVVGTGSVTRSSDVLSFTGRATQRAAWQLVLQHRAGSLDAAVGQARRRNLWLSFGILAVLAAGVGLVVINAERSQKLAAQQMDFVATVSHELRTPLTVIRSAAQNLAAGVVTEPAQAKRYGDLIETEGRRLTDMVEQVLEFAGLSGNRGLRHAQPIDAGALAKDVVESCAALFEAERVDVAVEVAAETPAVLADEGAIRRALQNLISNALKYGADGRWVGVNIRPGDGGRHEVQISVRDQGRGIDPEDLPHIFDAFYRGRYAADRQIHGNGLGLSLVKRIAEAHGGRVSVASQPGEGATFTLHLPAAAGTPASQPIAEPASEHGA